MHWIEPEHGALDARPVAGSDGSLHCSRCGGRVLADWVDRVAA